MGSWLFLSPGVSGFVVPTMEEYVEEYGHSVRDAVTIDKGKVVSKRRLGTKSPSSLKLLFFELFLPRGYPHSVSADYLDYQIWDTVQAFASSMTAALATEAILRGAGVGDQNASVLAAAVAWLLKDGLGMVSRIWFTWFSSAKLDSDCKRWRLVADALNDIAFSLDLIAPMIPRLFTPIVCLSSVARSVVGVAGGATRTVVTQHQARMDNTADVSAKDGAQETLVNISALLCSLALLPMVSGHQVIIWVLYFLFTYIHLYANYRAVTSLNFRSFNRSLLHIVVRKYVRTGEVCGIEEANSEEPLIWSFPGRRHWGYPLSEVLASDEKVLKHVEQDLAVACHPADDAVGCVYLAVSSTCDCETQLMAAFYAEHVFITQRYPTKEEAENFLYGCRLAGWSLNNHRLALDQWTYSRKTV